MPRVTLIILQSLNNIIAKSSSDSLDWGSKEDKKFFKSKTIEIGNCVLGSKTFENLPRFIFNDSRQWFVMTSKPEKYRDVLKDNLFFLNLTPNDFLKFCEEKQIQEVALIGGASLNNSFLKSGLVDEIYITLSPNLFAGGIENFSLLENDISLRLIDFRLQAKNEIVLHYEVLK